MIGISRAVAGGRQACPAVLAAPSQGIESGRPGDGVVPVEEATAVWTLESHHSPEHYGNRDDSNPNSDAKGLWRIAENRCDGAKKCEHGGRKHAHAEHSTLGKVA